MMRVTLHQGDITVLDVDAVVNAANNALRGGGGVDGAIHQAGGAAIDEACREIRRTQWPDGLPTGRAVATTAGRMVARWVIHTVGPVYSATEDRSPLLRSCYTESLAVAADIGARTAAFPLISAGVFGWPKEDAIRQALTVLTASDAPLDSAMLVLFDAEAYELAARIRDELAS